MKRSVTLNITLDLRAVALLSVALLLMGLMIAATSAEAIPRSEPPAPQATPGLDADKVDGHHAGPSNGTKSQRANRVLWAQSNGKFSTKALPMAQLDNRYLNDDQNETISGNLQQPPNYNGLVKAAVMMWYNGNCSSFNPYSSTTCSKVGTGQYEIDFNFQVNNRYLVITVVSNSDRHASFVFAGINDVIKVYTWDSSDGAAKDSTFMVTVF